jgi:hypothetical protein
MATGHQHDMPAGHPPAGPDPEPPAETKPGAAAMASTACLARDPLVEWLMSDQDRLPPGFEFAI